MQYDFINSIQLAQDRERVNREIARLSGASFPGAEIMMDRWLTELHYINQKETDFVAYLNNSNGLYNNIFTGLEDVVSRMNLATFCRVSGFVSIPKTEAELYFKELVTFDSEENPVFDWDRIEEWLNKDISDAQWVAIAMVFNMLSCDDDLTRFFHLMLVQVDDVYNTEIASVGTPYTGQMVTPAWQLDMEILGRLMAGLGILSNEIKAQQSAAINSGAELLNQLRNQQDSIIQNLGILAFFYQMQLNEGLIFTGTPHTVGKPLDTMPTLFSLSFISDAEGDPSGVAVTFIGGSSPGTPLLPGPISGGVFDEQKFYMSSPILGGLKNVALADVYYDRSGNLLVGAANIVTAHIMKTVLNYASKGVAGVFNGLQAFSKYMEGIVKSQQFVNAGVGADFRFYSILVVNEFGAVDVIQIPSFETQVAFDFFNETLESRGVLGSHVTCRRTGAEVWVPESGVTLDDFYNRPADLEVLWERYFKLPPLSQ